ncbi:MAG: acyltransferase family protein, partial [Beijerinckiaceae bacterium]
MTTVSEAIRRPYDNFTILRLALSLAVVVSHAASVGTGRHTDEPLYALTGYTLGEHGVNGFFAVSGFLVAMSWDRRGGPLPF